MGNILKAFLIILIFFILSLPFFYRVKIDSFFIDETYWLLSSKYYKLLIIDHIPLKDLNAGTDNFWIELTFYDQPPVVKYMLIGASFFMKHKIEDINVIPWHFERDPWCTQRDFVPKMEVLISYRYACAFFGFLSCVMIFLIARKVSNNYAAAIAALSTAYNTEIAYWCSKVMAEPFLLFFICLSIYWTIFFLESFNKRRYLATLSFCLLAGVSSALAGGTKLNGFIVVFIFLFACLALILKQIVSKAKNKTLSLKDIFKDGNIWYPILYAVLFIIITAEVFISINPYLQDGLFLKLKAMISYRANHAVVFARWDKFALSNLTEKLIYIWRVCFSPTSSRGLVILKNPFDLPLYFLLFCIGFLIMVRDEIFNLKKNNYFSSRFFILIWVFIMSSIFMYMMFLGWVRYFLPLLLPINIIVGYSLGSLIGRKDLIVR